MDYSHKGFRCYASTHLRTVKGDLPVGAQGTICYEYESLGRIQILVEWDAGFSVPVFPGEIGLKEEGQGAGEHGNGQNAA